MKTYKLYKALVFKTGLIFAVNQFGSKWLEIRMRGKLIHVITFSDRDPGKFKQERRGLVLQIAEQH